MSDESKKVGYGKPPKKSQFKPGQSGNPRGRPRGRVSFEKKIEKALAKTVPLTINGERQRVSFEDAAILRMCRSLITASPEKLIAILKFMLAHKPSACEEDAFDFSRLSDTELDDLERLVMKGSGKPSPGQEGDGLNGPIG